MLNSKIPLETSCSSKLKTRPDNRKKYGGEMGQTQSAIPIAAQRNTTIYLPCIVHLRSIAVAKLVSDSSCVEERTSHPGPSEPLQNCAFSSVHPSRQ